MGQSEPKCGAQLIVGFGFQWMESCMTPVLSIPVFTSTYVCFLSFVVLRNLLSALEFDIIIGDCFLIYFDIMKKRYSLI